MRIKTGMSVKCYDQNEYNITRTTANWAFGRNDNGNQRLFKLNGQYAGADRTKNVSKVS